MERCIRLTGVWSSMELQRFRGVEQYVVTEVQE